MKRAIPSSDFFQCDQMDNPKIPTSLLSKYHYRHLGALERDLDSFNREAGLPAEVVEVLSQLYLLAQRPKLFLQSQLLADIAEFFMKIPEGLLPVAYASKICSSKSTQSIRGHLKSLPLENYCAFKCVAQFFKAVSFGEPVLVPFEMIEAQTSICAAVTPAPRDDRFKLILLEIFMQPHKYFGKLMKT